MSLIEDLKKKTVFELKAYAKANGIDLVGSNTKKEILEVIFNFVPIQEFPGRENIEEKPKNIKPEKNIGLYSIRNIHWTGVGSLNEGYNIVSKEESEKWLTRKSVRLATPEEIASYYRKT